MKSEIFYSTLRERIESETLEFLNAQEEFLSPSTASSPRAVGDAIQHLLESSFDSILGESLTQIFSKFCKARNG